MEGEAGRCCLTQASCNGQTFWLQSLQSQQPLLLSRLLCIVPGKGFVCFQKSVASSQAFSCLFPSLTLSFWMLVMENVNPFPTSCPSHFPFQVIAFSFEALSFCFDDWNLFLFAPSCFITVFLQPLDILQQRFILLACCSACVNPHPSVSLSPRLLSPAYLHLCSFLFGTYPCILHSSCFPCNKAVLIFFSSCLGL